MNPIHHTAIRALPVVGALLLQPWCFAAESGPGPSTTSPSANPTPARFAVATTAIKDSTQPSKDGFISPRLAAILAARLPKYVPSAPGKASGSGAPSESAVADPDLYRLPRYYVHGPRVPAYRESDLLTQLGLEAVAMRRYITPLDRALNKYRIPLIGIPCEARAVAMYAEDERLQRMADFDRMERIATFTDRAAGAEIKRLKAATYQRTN